LRHWTYHGVTFDTREDALTAREGSGKSGPPFDRLDVIHEWDDEHERLDEEGNVVLIPRSPGWFARLRSRLARRVKIVEKVPSLLARGAVGLSFICLVLVMTLRSCGLREGEHPPVAIKVRQPTTLDELQQQEALINSVANKACADPSSIVARVSCKTGKLLGSTTVTTVP